MWNRIDLYKGLNVCLEIKKYMAGQHVGKQDVFQDMMMFIRCILRSSFKKKSQGGFQSGMLNVDLMHAKMWTTWVRMAILDEKMVSHWWPMKSMGDEHMLLPFAKQAENEQQMMPRLQILQFHGIRLIQTGRFLDISSA